MTPNEIDDKRNSLTVIMVNECENQEGNYLKSLLQMTGKTSYVIPPTIGNIVPSCDQ